jgi:hypothetical protein
VEDEETGWMDGQVYEGSGKMRRTIESNNGWKLEKDELGDERYYKNRSQTCQRMKEMHASLPSKGDMFNISSH